MSLAVVCMQQRSHNVLELVHLEINGLFKIDWGNGRVPPMLAQVVLYVEIETRIMTSTDNCHCKPANV